MNFVPRNPLLALALSSVFLTGCLNAANGSKGPSDPKNPTETPEGAGVNFILEAPLGFMPFKTLTQGEGRSIADILVDSQVDFEDADQVVDYFITSSDSSFEFAIPENNLLIPQAYFPSRNLIFQGLIVDFGGEPGSDLGTYTIDPVTDAIAELVLANEITTDDGFTDELQSLQISSMFALAAKKKLILEGLTPEQAEEADDQQLSEALDRLFTDASSPNENFRDFVFSYFDGVTWSNSDGSKTFDFDNDSVTYVDGGTTYAGGYTSGFNMGRTELRIDLEGLSEETVSLATDSEGLYFTFLSTRFDMQ